VKVREYKLLDHGYVRLVDQMGSDLAPLEAARMSTDNPTGVDEEKDDRLRNRLWGDGHTSPFEMNEAVFEIQCPMFVLRQLDRHRTIEIVETHKHVEGGAVEVFFPQSVESYDDMRKYTSRNEFSGRYSTMPDLYYIPEETRIRAKGKANKQGSDELLDYPTREHVRTHIKMTADKSRQSYERILETGCASEIARLCLPQNQYTKIRLKASLLHWFKFLNLRVRNDVQQETKAYARCMARYLQELWPKCWGVFEEHDLYGARLTRSERFALPGSRVFYTASRAVHLLGQEVGERRLKRLLKKLVGPDDDLLELDELVTVIWDE
jgi:thymidylate synthase (FAD)